jgi:hypothetical protein
MISNLSGSDIAAAVKMTRSAFGGTVLLVEGTNDSKIYEKFVDEGRCALIPAYGKANALEAIAILNKTRVAGILSIVDADFWHLHGIRPPAANVLVTDSHDIEVMMLESRAFDNVLRTYGSKSKIRAFLKQHGAGDLRMVLFILALPIGRLRLLSEEHSWRLQFNGLNYAKLLSGTLLVVDQRELVRQVFSLTSGYKVPSVDILTQLRKAESRNCDPRQTCHGHDLTAILGLALRNALGTVSRKVATRDNIEKWLCLAYDIVEFAKTELYRAAKDWEIGNKPYVVFNAVR